MEHEFREISRASICRTLRVIKRINWVMALKDYDRNFETLRLIPGPKLLFLNAYRHRLVTV